MSFRVDDLLHSVGVVISRCGAEFRALGWLPGELRKGGESSSSPSYTITPALSAPYISISTPVSPGKGSPSDSDAENRKTRTFT